MCDSTQGSLCPSPMTIHQSGAYLGGGFGGPGPPGSPKGRQKERKKRKGKEREGRKEEQRGKEGNKKEKRKKEGARKKKRRLNQYDERGAMQFQVQAGAPGKKTSGALN